MVQENPLFLIACLGSIQSIKEQSSFLVKTLKNQKIFLKKLDMFLKNQFLKNFPATVSDVVRMGLRNESDENKINEILQQLWIHELQNRRIGELSGGQLQRVFIAKALVNNPKILILDEPVTGIDQQSIELFYSILRELNSKQKITIIWSSHDLDAVNQLANHVACLNRTLFFHGESEKFFSDDELVKQYSEASMQEHMHHH